MANINSALGINQERVESQYSPGVFCTEIEWIPYPKQIFCFLFICFDPVIIEQLKDFETLHSVFC